jgi:peptidoglycan/LPS O-acetylase OafA/YrhL
LAQASTWDLFQLVIQCFHQAGARDAYLTWALQIGLPLALAWLSYRFIEEPFLRKRPMRDGERTPSPGDKTVDRTRRPSVSKE